MQQAVIPGGKLDIITQEEMRRLLREYTTRQQTRTRVRAPENVVLDANGFGQVDVYKVPIGWEFEARRVFLDLSTATESNLSAGTIALSGAGVAASYLRSGTRIQWALPQSPTGTGFRIPGVETWGEEQGPYLQNGEIFQVRVILGAPAANATLSVVLEGIETQSGSLK